MNSYEMYLENLLEQKEQEINMYKNFIERELKCRIKEESISRINFDSKDNKEEFYKVITIPQVQYVIKMSN